MTTVPCCAMRFTNGTRAYGPGASGFLKIGLGRGRVGDGDADPFGLLAPSPPTTAAALGDDGEEGVAVSGDVDGGKRVGNLMRSFRDSVVLSMGEVGVGSDLTTSGVFSSPSLSSSITSVGCGNGEARCGRRAVGLVGVGDLTATAGAWFGVWSNGTAGGTGGGVGGGRSGAREGAVSSRVR